MVWLGPSALIRRNFNASAFSDIIEKSVLPAVVCARPFPFSPWQSPPPHPIPPDKLAQSQVYKEKLLPV